MASAKKTTKARKWIKRMLIIGLSLIGAMALLVFAYMQHPKFGRLPSGARLERIQKSPHFKNGKFRNVEPKPRTPENVSTIEALGKFFFGDKSKRTPSAPVPSVKRDLHNLDAGRDVLVWFGHSSYFMQAGGKRILVDPVFSGAASPVSFTTKAFTGSDAYTVGDLPGIDYLFITHDHWDHLDYETILKLKPKVGKVVCALGVGEHLEYWGFKPEQIIEMHWGDETSPEAGVKVHCLTTHHFSGRGLSHERSMWAAFFVETPALRFYIGGDSGYGAHYAEAGERFGPMDLAILENGQYDPNWASIHMMPEETLQAAADLKTRRLLPVHNSKFSISNHDWDDPHRRVTQGGRAPNLRLLTPVIGEIVDLRDDAQTFAHWWESVGKQTSAN
ncbi:L-ascorbate metabolism protein UlaG (beta-lactamase superfamily) [Ereboglobus sp. PH5-5]|uniref:MBL fold metallo-hydrolase n=1 Tax=Ereboglobus sp. PH5-5 TaxID=2940529 RepID=UPI002406A8A2|nr:MBL fold metallo-hydrolase [Ereboglobus sp. PH5-5]MDF9831816.1 L-ascorbate metabolism protein UlaG (beta-lactamase superfamily) [Ereboglobus sp. PH5-5]